MKSLFVLLSLALLLSLSARAQDDLPESLGEFYSYGDRYYIEVVTLPGTAPPKGRALVAFKMMYDLLTFRRSSGSPRDPVRYHATPAFYVEAVATDGVVSDRAVWHDTITVDQYATTNSKRLFASGVVDLSLRPGVYTIKYTLVEDAPGSGFSESTGPIKMDEFKSASPAIGMPLFYRSVSGDTLTATGVGGGLFGQRLRVYVPLASADTPKTLRFDLLTSPKNEKEAARNMQSGFATLLGPSTLGPAMVSNGDIHFTLRSGERAGAIPERSYGAMIDTRTDDLEPGDYTLLLTYAAGLNTVTDSVRFRIRWVDQPVALYKTGYAIRTLYPIANDRTLDSLLAGEIDDQVAALRRFWDSRDPTPGTRYNEAKVEYYRRVDYAYFNFKSIGQKDGAFTDRGKIYILYGAPTEVSREMRPDALPREVWTYRNSVAQSFVFVDERKTGDYRLAEYHDL